MRALLLVLLFAGLASAQEMIAGGDFEGDWTGLARPWAANCYGDNQYRFERVPGHQSQAAQRLTCGRHDSGAVQVLVPGLKIVKGQTYTITLWLRGQIPGRLFVGFRQLPAPYARYLVRYVRVDPTWRQYAIVGTVPVDDAACGLFLSFQGEGWIEVDDVSARPGNFPLLTPAIDARPQAGNRVYNAGFELGAAGWAPLNGGLQPRVAASPQGRQHLRVGGTVLEGRPLVTVQGQVYSISAYLRRPGGPAEAVLELVEYMDAGGDQPTARTRLAWRGAIGPQWTRVQATSVWNPDFTVGAIPRVVCGAGGFECDGVQVEEGELRPFAPADGVTVALDTPLAKRYPQPGETVPLRLAVVGDEARREAEVQVRTVDLWGREVAAEVRRVPLAQGAGELEVPWRAPTTGLFRVEARCGTSAVSDVVLCALPPAPLARPLPDTFFGMHGSGDVAPNALDLAQTTSVRAGCSWRRWHDFTNRVQWYEVEPRPGERRWFDAEIDQALGRGFRLLGTLARTPAWAAKTDRKSPQHGGVPRSMDELAAYVRDTVRHYRGRIAVWEIWNEPYGQGFFDGSPEEYAEVLKVASRACKEADPNCTVIGVCAYLGLPDWVERVLKVSGTACFDAFSYHRYVAPDEVREKRGQPPLVVREVTWVRELMRRYGGERPIWQTEGGVACPSLHAWLPPDGYPVPSALAAATVCQAAVLMRSAGVQRWCYYYTGYPSGGRGDFYTLGNAPYILMDYDGSPKATYAALAAAGRFIGQGRFERRVADGSRREYWFSRDGRDTVAVVWREGHGEPTSVNVPAGYTAYDVVGAPLAPATVRLDDSPVYLVRREARL